MADFSKLKEVAIFVGIISMIASFVFLFFNTTVTMILFFVGIAGIFFAVSGE